MNKIALILIFASSSAVAQYTDANNQLKFANGLQIDEKGGVQIDKKKWSQDKKKREDLLVITNRKKRDTNTWEEGVVNIKRHKNKVEIKYRDIKAKDLEVEYIFQGVREGRNDIVSLTNFENKKVSNFSTCVGTKCLTLTREFCDKLSMNIGTQTKTDATEKAGQCLHLAKSMASFAGDELVIKDLKLIHEQNLGKIDQKIYSYFNEETKFASSRDFDLDHMIELGDRNQDYFVLLIQALGSCEKNFP